MTSPTVVLRSNTTQTPDGSPVATQSLVQTEVQTLLAQITTLAARVEALEVQATTNQATSVGEILMVSSTQLPPQTLWCHGQALSKTEYPQLFGRIGVAFGGSDTGQTFNVPDFRGLFPRGTGVNGLAKKANGQPVTGAALGIVELDQIQGHWHALTPATSPGMYTSAGTGGGSGAKVSSNQTVGSPTEDTVNGTPRTGDETRPACLNIEFCIRY